jgi:nucleoside-diphosphate-sugar epimerase
MNILVLGGTGAMGAPLSKLLVASGNNVYVTSRSAHKSCERLHYLQGNAKDEIFLKACLSRMHYDAIVDFMSYSTNCLPLLKIPTVSAGSRPIPPDFEPHTLSA